MISRDPDVGPTPVPTPPPKHRLLVDFPVIVTVPMQWGDLDLYGHVNNTVFFRLFETARIAYLERCGMIETYDRDRIGAILHSTDCRFRRALGFPDTVQVGGRAASVERDRFTMAYRIVSLQQDEIAGEGSGVIVSFDYAKREKTALPASVRKGIEEVERGR